MMLLGLFLHSAINYFPFPENYLDQIYLDAQTSPIMDYSVKFIHTFRMPVFFVVAGFFAAFLFARNGPRGFLRHRMDRIAKPLVVAWIILYPITVASMLFANSYSMGPPLPYPPPLYNILQSLLLHLWFLYFLVIFCVIAVPVALAVELLDAGLRKRLADIFERAVHHPGIFIVLTALTALMIYPMRFWSFDPAQAIIPAPIDLAANGLFFVFGWLVFIRRDSVEGFKSRAWIHLILGIILHVVYIIFYNRGYPEPGSDHIYAMIALGSSIWFLIYGFIGLFLRYLNHPSAVWRYMADASYWVYLIHLPITVLIPPVMAGWDIPATIKFVIVVLVASVISVISYHYCVRATFIGERLNGRRHLRMAPWRQTPAA